MRLEIRDDKRIADANINLNGITVVSGKDEFAMEDVKKAMWADANRNTYRNFLGIYEEEACHPIRQIAYGKDMVKNYQYTKEVRVLIVISPYVLEAIEVYAKAYGVPKEAISYYHVVKEGRTIVVKDCTDDPSEIYDDFAEPFQILEDIRCNGLAEEDE